LPFLQHKENCELLLLDFANHSLSISPQSHRAKADASLFPNNCNVSLLREGCACVVTCCMVRHSQHRRLLRSYGILDGLADSIRCLTRHSLYKRLQRSCADSNVFLLNSIGTLICGTQNIFVSYLYMMETPQSCLQKSTPT
jgi:hypothetical protein